MPIIEQLLERMRGRSRWVPHNFNPSDGLTKLKGAHLAPLMALLKSGVYHLKTEEANLKDRADEKLESGHKKRLKQGKTNSVSTSSFVRTGMRNMMVVLSPEVLEVSLLVSVLFRPRSKRLACCMSQ